MAQRKYEKKAPVPLATWEREALLKLVQRAEKIGALDMIKRIGDVIEAGQKPEIFANGFVEKNERIIEALERSFALKHGTAPRASRVVVDNWLGSGGFSIESDNERRICETLPAEVHQELTHQIQIRMDKLTDAGFQAIWEVNVSNAPDHILKARREISEIGGSGMRFARKLHAWRMGHLTGKYADVLDALKTLKADGFLTIEVNLTDLQPAEQLMLM